MCIRPTPRDLTLAALLLLAGAAEGCSSDSVSTDSEAGGRASGAGGAGGAKVETSGSSAGTTDTKGTASALGGRDGSGGASASGAGGAEGDDPFVLDWEDDFNALDDSLWQAQSFTWDGNQAQFTPDNVAVADGKLTISLTSAPADFEKPYLGVELRSTKTLTYGKVSASMRFASGSGVVSGLVLFYTPYPNCDWNEIDIEHLGKSANSSQLNCQVFMGKAVNDCTTSVTPKQDSQVVDLGVNAEEAFHQYDIEWTPVSVKFFIDGTLLRTWTANISRLSLPQNILLTIWASKAASWAGALNATSAPTSADVDWIKIYKWTGSQ